MLKSKKREYRMPLRTLEGFLSLCASSMTAYCQAIWERKSWSINAMSYVVNRTSKGNMTCQYLQLLNKSKTHHIQFKRPFLQENIAYNAINSHQSLIVMLHAQKCACENFVEFLYLQHTEEHLDEEQIWQSQIPNHL